MAIKRSRETVETVRVTRSRRVKTQTVATSIKVTETKRVVVKSESSVQTTKKHNYIEPFQTGLDHLVRVDRHLEHIIKKSQFPAFYSKSEDVQLDAFASLGRGILAQQVSGAAAKAILRKFKRQFASEQQLKDAGIQEEPETPQKANKQAAADAAALFEAVPFPTPQQVAQSSVEELRKAGLSQRKAEYMIGLAQAFLDNVVSDKKFQEWTDDEIVDNLVALRGLGPWSADMFLLFGLQRMDVFSIGDLGVRRGFENYVASHPSIQAELKTIDWKDAAQVETLLQKQYPGTSTKATNRKAALTPKSKKSGKQAADIETAQMEYVANKFRPFRSAFQMVLWQYAATDIDIVQKQ